MAPCWNLPRQTAPTVRTTKPCCCSYADFIDASEKDLKQAYGVIKPRKVNLTVDGAEVEAVRCDIQAYYAVLATITYPSGDVVYVSGLTKLASINDIVNLVESVALS